MPRRTLTDKSIAALKVAKRTNIADPKLTGHYVRVTPNGAKSFCAVARQRAHWRKTTLIYVTAPGSRPKGNDSANIIVLAAPRSLRCHKQSASKPRLTSPLRLAL